MNANQLAQSKMKASSFFQAVDLDLSLLLHRHWFQQTCFYFFPLHAVRFGWQKLLLALKESKPKMCAQTRTLFHFVFFKLGFRTVNK